MEVVTIPVPQGRCVDWEGLCRKVGQTHGIITAATRPSQWMSSEQFSALGIWKKAAPTAQPNKSLLKILNVDSAYYSI